METKIFKILLLICSLLILPSAAHANPQLGGFNVQIGSHGCLLCGGVDFDLGGDRALLFDAGLSYYEEYVVAGVSFRLPLTSERSGVSFNIEPALYFVHNIILSVQGVVQFRVSGRHRFEIGAGPGVNVNAQRLLIDFTLLRYTYDL